MKLCDINPHIRFAEQGLFKNDAQNNSYVLDCRIFYILNGKISITIENQLYELKKGDLFYCCGGKMYSLNAKSQTSLFFLNFDMTQSHNHITTPISTISVKPPPLPPPIYDEIEDSDILNSHLVLHEASFFETYINAIVDEFNKKKFFYREKSSSVLKDLLIELHRRKLKSSTNTYNIVNCAIDYINENYTRNITNAEIASTLGYHEYYLNRLFINHTGTSMHKYMLNLRLSEAKFLILNTNIPLSKIAEDVGFNNNTHFSNYFKKVYGLSPSKYRLNFRNNI